MANFRLHKHYIDILDWYQLFELHSFRLRLQLKMNNNYNMYVLDRRLRRPKFQMLLCRHCLVHTNSNIYHLPVDNILMFLHTYDIAYRVR
jgi:hypothetical protein